MTDGPDGLDRRQLLAELALFAALGGCRRPAALDAGPSPALDASAPSAAPARAFAPAHAATLAAVAELVLPSDAEPGAREAKVADYIDRELARPELGGLKTVVQGGLLALDRRAERQAKRRFVDLSPAERHDLFAELAHDQGRGAQFVELVVVLTLEGFFGDPRHGGNHGEVGWALAGGSPVAHRRPR